MKKIKIGRNQPCPCGSGKKFKKCCYGKDSKILDTSLKNINEILPPYSEIDYGTPVLDENFFKSNSIHEISAHRLIYSNLINPETAKLASVFSSQMINRGKTERNIIENTNSVEVLIEMMIKGIDSINHEILKEKILKQKEIAIPLIIDELKSNEHEQFVELAIIIIHLSGSNCSKEIYEILLNTPSSAYKKSLLCMLLGFYCKEEYTNLIWNYYHYFKENYPQEKYYDGPLLGLIEMKEQEKEKNKTIHGHVIA
ncbi:SEC-C metal-binding domain-containing protein [Desulfobacterales bacterium HSG17]|nr:SEC-C metal-binding domain-containing protein [Desulfobacterales bacterium HSG17]